MKCYYHEDRDAVATCKRCGKSLCKECASKYQIVYCADCAAQMRAEAVNKKERDRQSKLIDTKSEIIKAFVIGAIAAIVGVALMIWLSSDGPITFSYVELIQIAAMFFFFPFGWSALSAVPFFYGLSSSTLFVAMIFNLIKFVAAFILGIPLFFIQMAIMCYKYYHLKKA